MNDKNIEEKCCAGCKRYTGGEARHLPECIFYPESLSRIYDEKDIILTQYKEALRELVGLSDMIKITDMTNDSFEFTCKLSKAITKAEQLLY